MSPGSEQERDRVGEVETRCLERGEPVHLLPPVEEAVSLEERHREAEEERDRVDGLEIQREELGRLLPSAEVAAGPVERYRGANEERDRLDGLETRSLEREELGHLLHLAGGSGERRHGAYEDQAEQLPSGSLRYPCHPG